MDDAEALLARAPAVFRTMLRDLPDAWINSNYGDRTFSPFDVIGHLIHGEKTDWLPRARMILEHGESQVFEPFDRYVMYEESRGKTIATLLDEFERLRNENLVTLRGFNITVEMLKLRGRHPALGPVTLVQLLAAWVAHDFNHIAQIAKALAYQYVEEMGPWREYMSIMNPPAVLADRPK
jgi:hypothetical protein